MSSGSTSGSGSPEGPLHFLAEHVDYEASDFSVVSMASIARRLAARPTLLCRPVDGF